MCMKYRFKLEKEDAHLTKYYQFGIGLPLPVWFELFHSVEGTTKSFLHAKKDKRLIYEDGKSVFRITHQQYYLPTISCIRENSFTYPEVS